MTYEFGGRLYPAKDARMTAAQFQAFYPQWEKLRALQGSGDHVKLLGARRRREGAARLSPNPMPTVPGTTQPLICR